VRDQSALSDPTTCGEDLDHNIRRVLDYAPRHCNYCLNYHMIYTIRRSIAGVGRVARDRDQLVARIGETIRARSGSSDPIDVVVVGVADSQILAICAHAAFIQGPELFARVRFTVLDRCDTPLQLCRDFGLRHGLPLETRTVDLVETREAFAGDIVVSHSLFNYVPLEHHVTVLSKIGGWLKPDGWLLFSASVRTQDLQSSIGERDDQATRRIRAALDSGALQIAEPREVFEARLKNREIRVAEFHSAAAIYDLFERCRLTVLEKESLFAKVGMPERGAIARELVRAVLSRDAS
jgi:hypothetical protein